jgi:hypothetical protein
MTIAQMAFSTVAGIGQNSLTTYSASQTTPSNTMTPISSQRIAIASSIIGLPAGATMRH